MDGKDNTSDAYKILSLICLFIGLAFVTTAAISDYNYFYLVQHGVRTTGRIVGCSIENKNVPSVPISRYSLGKPINYDARCYQYEVQVETTSGKKENVFVGARDNRALRPSDTVAVLYLSDAPKTSAMIDYGPNCVSLCLGLFLTGLSALYYFRIV